MPIRRILVPVSGERDADPLLTSAFEIAKARGATVEGVFAKRPYAIVPGIGIMPVPGTIDLLIEEAEKQIAKVAELGRRTFADCAKGFSAVTSKLTIAEGMTGDIMAERGRLADLAVVGDARRYDSEYWEAARDALLFHSARPVLVLPDGKAAGALGETVVVAWKDGLESARALGAALPFIASAKSVQVVAVHEDEASGRTLKEVEEYLRLHHQSVSSELIDDGRGAGESLLARVSGVAGALLVMGAYSHWRLRQRIFGGVTEHVLRETEVPVLLAH